MPRLPRIAAWLFAAILAVVAAGWLYQFRREGLGDNFNEILVLLFLSVVPAAYYLLFAAWCTGRASGWSRVLLALALGELLITTFYAVREGHEAWPLTSLPVGLVFLENARANAGDPVGKWGRLLRPLRSTPLLLLLGAALTLASLRGEVSFNQSLSGLEVLRGRAEWPTSVVGLVNNPLSFSGEAPLIRLGPLFQAVGYAMYLTAVLASVAGVVLLAASQFSTARMRAHAVFAPLSAVTLLTAGWAASDIFWGWHFELGSILPAAAAGVVCWLGALGLAAAIAYRAARRRLTPTALAGFFLFQALLVAFGVAIMPPVGGEVCGGVALLLSGVQLQACAYASALSATA